MYFWNIDKLKSELSNGTVTELDFFKYLFATFVLVGIGGIPFFSPNDLDMFSSGISIPISLFGLYWAFHVSDKHNFIGKFISIAWVMTIRIIPLTIALAVLATSSGSLDTTIQDVIVMAFIECIFFWRVAHHMKGAGSSSMPA